MSISRYALLNLKRLEQHGKALEWSSLTHEQTLIPGIKEINSAHWILHDKLKSNTKNFNGLWFVDSYWLSLNKDYLIHVFFLFLFSILTILIREAVNEHYFTLESVFFVFHSVVSRLFHSSFCVQVLYIEIPGQYLYIIMYSTFLLEYV